MTTEPQITEQDIQRVEEQFGTVHAALLTNLKAWLDDGVNPYAVTKFDRSHTAAELQEQFKDLPDGEFAGIDAQVAGRLMAIRNSGMFMVLQDASGRIQVFNYLKELSDEQKTRVQRFDIGDIVGVSGAVRRTPRGELTINAASIELISKCLDPLPEKYHGISDPELEARERHKSIVSDEVVRSRLVARSKIISSMRRTLDDQGYLEVETSFLHPIAGGANAKPFVTHHNSLDMDLFLRIAPELYLKRVIASGLTDKVYEIGKNFRNEGLSFKHNPEFTSLEVYVAYVDYEEMMRIVEDVIVNAVTNVTGGDTEVEYEETRINFQRPWKRMSMDGLVLEKTGVDFKELKTADEARAAAEKLGIEVPKDASWGKILEAVFEEEVESSLDQPIHVTDLPTDISPLSKPRGDDPRFAERFESYIFGREIANAFSELNDPFLQNQFFQDQAKMRQKGDEEASEPDDDYVRVLEFGLPAAGGLGIGIDRLAMFLTDAHHIRQVVLFPVMRHRPDAPRSISSTLNGDGE